MVASLVGSHQRLRAELAALQSAPKPEQGMGERPGWLDHSYAIGVDAKRADYERVRIYALAQEARAKELEADLESAWSESAAEHIAAANLRAESAERERDAAYAREAKTKEQRDVLIAANDDLRRELAELKAKQ